MLLQKEAVSIQKHLSSKKVWPLSDKNRIEIDSGSQNGCDGSLMANSKNLEQFK